MHSMKRTLLADLGFADSDRANPEHSLACRYLAGEALQKLIDFCYRDEIKEFRKERLTHAMSEEGMFSTTPEVRDCFYKIFCEIARSQQTHYFKTKRRSIHVAVESGGRELHTHALLEIDPGEISISGSPQGEVAINKGNANYKTTVGFADLIVNVDICYPIQEIIVMIPSRCSEQEAKDAFALAITKAKVSKIYCRQVPKNAIGVEVKIARVDMETVVRQINLYKEFISVGKWVVAAPWGITADEDALLQRAGIRFLRLGENFEKYKSESLFAAPIASESI